jgi:hypothetical protein
MGYNFTLPVVSGHRFYQTFSTITFRASNFMACVKREITPSNVLQKVQGKAARRRYLKQGNNLIRFVAFN